MRHFVLATAALCLLEPLGSLATESSDQPTLNCNVGPVTKTFAETSWLVYSCNDARTVIVMSASGNPAMPFYFMLSPEGPGYHVRGEGTGSKAITDAAYKELSALSASAIGALVEETKHVAK